MQILGCTNAYICNHLFYLPKGRYESIDDDDDDARIRNIHTYIEIRKSLKIVGTNKIIEFSYNRKKHARRIDRSIERNVN